MNRYSENRAKDDTQLNPPETDYDAMWIAIEKEVNKRKFAQQMPQLSRFRTRLIPLTIAFSCFLVIAVPVFAGVALNWDSLHGGGSVNNALNHGIGQRYDLSDSSKGITMGLHGVVTDGEKMKMLVSLGSDMSLDQYDVVEFEKMKVTDKPGISENLNGYLNYDTASEKLLGIYETKDQLQQNINTYTLEAENLVFYKYEDIPLRSDIQVGDVIHTGSKLYPTLQIQSINQSSNKIIVRYTISSSQSDQGQWDPHLILKTSNDGEDRGRMTILPNDGSDILIEQVFNNLTEKEWRASEVLFSNLDEAKRIASKWNLTFKADGKKSSEALYTQKLQTYDDFQKKSGIKLEQLIITPLEIKVPIQQDSSMEQMKAGVVWYNTVKLAVGNNVIEGGLSVKGDDPNHYQRLYQFQSSEWYKDWSQVPLKLILEDAVVTKRDMTKNWISLINTSNIKQSAELEIDDHITIHITYYSEGDDLIVETNSDSPQFQGINQSSLRYNGEVIYPESNPSGPEHISKKVERYKNIDPNETIEFNPGFYKYTDSSLNTEIDLIAK